MTLNETEETRKPQTALQIWDEFKKCFKNYHDLPITKQKELKLSFLSGIISGVSEVKRIAKLMQHNQPAAADAMRKFSFEAMAASVVLGMELSDSLANMDDEVKETAV